MANEIYFNQDFEDGKIAGAPKSTHVHFPEGDVTNSGNVAQEGNRSMKTQYDPAGGTGARSSKCAVFTTYLTNELGYAFANRPWGGQTGAYFSAHFYIDDGFDHAVTGGTFSNVFQWKVDSNTGTVGGHRKQAFTFNNDPGVGYRTIELRINENGLQAGDLNNLIITGADGEKRFRSQTPTQIPTQQWWHLETFSVFGDPHRVGGQDALTPGRHIVYIDGVEEMDVAHPNLNTLTSNRFGGGFSTNRYVYWVMGTYVGAASPNPPYRIYFDKLMATNYQVGGTGPPPPPPPPPVTRYPEKGYGMMGALLVD